MTKPTRQNTAATTTGPEVVDNALGLRPAAGQTPGDGFRAHLDAIPQPGCASVSVCFVLMDTSSKNHRPPVTSDFRAARPGTSV